MRMMTTDSFRTAPVWHGRASFPLVVLACACLHIPGLQTASSTAFDLLLSGKSESRQDLLVYNRVAKAGSSTLQEYLDVLSKQLGYKALHFVKPPKVEFYYVNEVKHTSWSADPAEIREFVDHISSYPDEYSKRVSVDYHFHYVDFAQYGQKQPTYINVVRDPVSRIISQYFYARYGPRSQSKKDHVKKNFGLWSVDECLELYEQCNCTGNCLHHLSCTKNKCGDLFENFNRQLMWFCPWGNIKCARRDRATLELVKSVVVQKYDIVGVLEHFDQTFEMLEVLLPDWFKGLTTTSLPDARTNEKKEEISKATKQKLYHLNALDMEFYTFVVDLFNKRYKAMKQWRARRLL